MTIRSRPENILCPLITVKDIVKLRKNFSEFLKRHKEPKFEFHIKRR